MILHAPKVVAVRYGTRHTTLCGRSNRRSDDGMNIAVPPAVVTCRLCLRLLAAGPRPAGAA